MQGKKILIGIIAVVLAMVFAFIFVIAPIDVVAGLTTFGDYYSQTTVSAVLLFLCSAIASFCFFKKIGKRALHSSGSAVIIGLVGLLFAGIDNFVLGKKYN